MRASGGASLYQAVLDRIKPRRRRACQGILGGAMNFDFNGQVATVTGAAGNLGVAVARAFRDAGGSLALIDHSPDRLPSLFPDLANSRDHFFTPPTDVTDPASVARTVEEIKRRFGRIDILVNTAGGYRAGPPLHETPLSDWEF